MAKSKLLFKAGEDWTPEILDKAWVEIEKIAKELRVEYYPPQFEIISAEQMLEAYTSIGMPIFYNHWSFGKQAVKEKEAYAGGQMGLAYEIVINSNPTISYLMEQNNALLQALVMAHSICGHGTVFKNNVYFTQNTDAEGIVDYLEFAKKYIEKCEEKYGYQEVEMVLDACHSLQNLAVDKYRRRPKRLKVEEEEDEAWKSFDVLIHSLAPEVENTVVEKLAKEGDFEPYENLLYFIEKKAPFLPPWKKEIVRIVRKIAQYFYPQRMTKIVNEGYASFVHSYIMNRMFDKGLIDSGSMTEFFALNAGVFRQRQFHPFNPYKLGISIFEDIRRICTNPTEEDKEWFPNLIGKDWVEEVNYAMANFNDEGFILQYLSPKVARDMGMFALISDSNEGYSTVSEIPEGESFQRLRERLARTNSYAYSVPNIQAVKVDWKTSRLLTLQHTPSGDGNRTLDFEQAADVVRNMAFLWGFPVSLETYDTEGNPLKVPSGIAPTYI